MAKSKRGILSTVKQGAFRSVLGATRMLPTAAPERLMQGGLVSRNKKDVKKLMKVAWSAENAGDKVLAIKAWLEVIKDPDPDTSLKAAKKFAVLETSIRKRIIASGAADVSTLWGGGPALPIEPDARQKHAFRPAVATARLAFLEEVWTKIIPSLEHHQQLRIGRGFAQNTTPKIKRGDLNHAMTALQPLLRQWPENQTGQRLYFRILSDMLVDNPEQASPLIDQWWAHYHANPDLFEPKTHDQLWNQTARIGRVLIDQERPQEAERLIMPAFKEWPDQTAGLGLLAEASALTGAWRTSADRWQLLAAVCNPVTTKSRTHVAQNVKEMTRRTKHATNQLRHARVQLATELRAQGKNREFNELVNRIVETIPDQRVLKNNREIVDLVCAYVQDALRDDGVPAQLKLAADGKPLRIAICLDVLKISDVHTHARVVYAMCRNLMEMNPDIETHVIITNERFAVSTPVVVSSFNPVREDTMAEGARKALPEFFGSRFFMHVLRNSGLEGLVRTSKAIIDIAPDVILYGGGHRGMFSNESRLIRHCLYDHFPTAFFYIQANNQVDDKLDMIIARGPHEIDGDHGDATVRVQPYPTIVRQGFVNEVPIDMDKHARKHIISAITGVRMDVRMKEIDPADLEQMMSILDDAPGAVWHLIGATDPRKVISRNPVIKARVQAGQMVVHPVLPFDQFTDLVGNASLFFHIPGFTGGSGGATVARRGGIPIVTFEHSDVSGRQPAQTVFATDDLAGAVAKSVRVLNDPDDWRQTVEAQFAHTNWILETSASGFYDCLTEAMTLSKSRLDPNFMPPADNIVSDDVALDNTGSDNTTSANEGEGTQPLAQPVV